MRSYQPILKNEQLEKSLYDDGYLIIKNFLSPPDVNKLLDFYNTHLPVIDRDTIFNTVWHTDNLEYKKSTIEFITKIFRPACEQYFVNYKLFGGSFVVKPGNGKGTSQPHIDFCTVDEDRHRAFSLWVPLQQLTEKNGALMAVKGSHRFSQIFRGPNLPDPIENLRDWFWKMGKPELLDAGDLLIYDYRTVHGSPPNYTPHPRIAVSCSLTEINAMHLIFFADETFTNVHAYQVDIDKLLDNDSMHRIPHTTTPVKTWSYTPRQFTQADFSYVTSRNKKSWLNRLSAQIQRTYHQFKT